MNHGKFPHGKLAIRILVVIAAMFGVMDATQAICTGHSTRYVAYAGPINLTIPSGTPDGTLVYTEAQAIPRSDFECTSHELWGLELAPGWGPTPTSKTEEFPLGNSGLSFRIKTKLGNGVGYIASLAPLKAGGYKLEGDLILEIYKTGPLVPRRVVALGDLGLVRYGPRRIVDLVLGRDINVVAGSCETPDVAVAMGDNYKLFDFGGPGSTTREVPFYLHLNNCPQGITKINYQLQALTPVINAALGVVGLNRTSSAAGVGLQIKDANGMPVPLNTMRTFSGYPTNGTNFRIPLAANYYRVGTELLRPGAANTEVTFIMSYL
ncbi:fimbrial protein [Achromobacter insolitus]|uniref:fimbrial protein n=1 Tax=Achromobacter insolitus TaxID=217204 RepID=UPI00366F1ED4